MHITVNEELKAYIDPLTPDEHASLERSILAEGCRDALVLWGDVLVDGHNRYGICQKHGLPFQTVQNTRFQSMEDVHLWMIDQHLGRRSVSDFQRGVLALRKRAILAEQRTQTIAATANRDATLSEHASQETPQDIAASGPNPLKSRADIAKVARLSNSQVVQIEKIQKQAAPELVAAVKAGTISINAAAAVASLPAEEQKTAALGGKDELKQAAKRVREVNRKAPKEDTLTAENDTPETIQTLRQQVQALTDENQRLRQHVAELEARLQASNAPH
ncbi:plasmid replication/partition related protein [Limnohabitans sp. DM1]|uniref:plasmid replication/partition related protein n=1 Tax=Limnohabitans sp. DM1 TaxID=1597955 RepID=UPI000B7D6CA6|nr:plasmid replication/partition related protein [Limnohabitans sp. DM1]